MFRNRALLFQLSYLLGAIDTIEDWHLPIHQDDIQANTGASVVAPMLGRAQELERFHSVIRDVYFVAEPSELLGQYLLVDEIVLDQQNMEMLFRDRSCS